MAPLFHFSWSKRAMTLGDLKDAIKRLCRDYTAIRDKIRIAEHRLHSLQGARRELRARLENRRATLRIIKEMYGDGAHREFEDSYFRMKRRVKHLEEDLEDVEEDVKTMKMDLEEERDEEETIGARVALATSAYEAEMEKRRRADAEARARETCEEGERSRPESRRSKFFRSAPQPAQQHEQSRPEYRRTSSTPQPNSTPTSSSRPTPQPHQQPRPEPRRTSSSRSTPQPEPRSEQHERPRPEFRRTSSTPQPRRQQSRPEPQGASSARSTPRPEHRRNQHEQPQPPKASRPTSAPLPDAISGWHVAVNTSFANYSTITRFPDPPAWKCGKAGCETQTRQLAACACNIKSLFQGRVVKTERLRWHPDRFSACPEAQREEFKAKATEVFQVLNEMHASERK